MSPPSRAYKVGNCFRRVGSYFVGWKEVRRSYKVGSALPCLQSRQLLFQKIIAGLGGLTSLCEATALQGAAKQGMRHLLWREAKHAFIPNK